MIETIDVFTGEVKAGGKNCILRSNGIGSCVVVALFDISAGVGALTHILLPGRSPENDKSPATRYAEDAINEAITQLCILGASKEKLNACMVGGGNVLARDATSISNENIDSVNNYLILRGINIIGRAVGGSIRRTIRFDIDKMRVYYTEGDSKELLLWENNDASLKL